MPRSSTSSEVPATAKSLRDELRALLYPDEVLGVTYGSGSPHEAHISDRLARFEDVLLCRLREPSAELKRAAAVAMACTCAACAVDAGQCSVADTALRAVAKHLKEEER